MTDYRKRTLLHIACFRGSIEVLGTILENHRTLRIDTNSKDKNHDTPLNLACIRGYQEGPKEVYEANDKDGN